MVHLLDVHHVDHTQGDVHPCRQVLVLFCVKDERSNCLAVVLLHHNGLAVILIRLIPGFIIFDPFLTGIYKQQRQLKFPFSIHFSRLKRFDRPTIPTKLLDKLVNQWIINKLYINNQLSIPDVFNRLSIDIQWNINYYWTIRILKANRCPDYPSIINGLTGSWEFDHSAAQCLCTVRPCR